MINPVDISSASKPPPPRRQLRLPVQPAAAVWTQPMPVSREEQTAFFKREGFLVLPGVLDRAALAELDKEIQRFIAEHDTLPRLRDGVEMEKRADPRRRSPVFRKIGGISSFSEPFDRLMRHPRIVEALHAVMGPTIQMYRDVLMMKPARVGREKPWHQDSVYWPWEPMDMVSAMTALDDALPENGCLQVIPRTHLALVQHFGKELQVEIDAAMQARTRYVPLQAGDTLLFHSLLLHASEPNHSDFDRRVCIFSYKTPQLRYIGRPEGAPHATSILVHEAR